MRQGYTIAKDSAGNPSLLADCRTPIWEQEKAMSMLKAGLAEPPDNAASVELICSERGTVAKWIATKAKEIKQKKGSTK